MNNQYYYDPDNMRRFSDYDYQTINEFETFIPSIIEDAIANKKIRTLRSKMSEYFHSAEDVLEYSSLDLKTDCVLAQMKKFLHLAIHSDDLNVLRAVWNEGARDYFEAHTKKWGEFLNILSHYMKIKRHKKMILYLIKQIPCDEYFIKLIPYSTPHPITQNKRSEVYGNLLCAAVYYNANDFIEPLHQKQPHNLSSSLKQYSQNNIYQKICDTTLFNGSIMTSFQDPRKILCSYNPTFYIIDTGNIAILEHLLKLGYIMDFSANGFWEQVSSFGHIDFIDYYKLKLQKHFKETHLIDIFKEGYYLLLDYVLPENTILPANLANHLFCHHNLHKIMKVLLKKQTRIDSIETSLLYALYHSDGIVLNDCLKLWNQKTPVDITFIFPYLDKNIDFFQVMAHNLQMFCQVEQLSRLSSNHLKHYQLIFKHIDLKFSSQKELSNLAKAILSKNAKTSIKLLYNYNFINQENYTQVLNYITDNNLDNLIQPLIETVSLQGGIKKNYEL